jgi:hypothetical protein
MTRLFAALALLVSAGALAQQPPAPEQIMADNDLNDDGVITREEAQEAGTPLAMFFDMIDSNGDGRITMEELQNMGPPT